jgi:hypothetical protein
MPQRMPGPRYPMAVIFQGMACLLLSSPGNNPPVVAVPAVASWKVGLAVLSLMGLLLPTLRVGLVPEKVRPVLGFSRVGFCWLAPL